jgi:ATP-dependent RNA helicase DDX6/DHH1
LKETYI